MTLFEYQDYKKYLVDWIATRPKGGRGVRSALARAIRCQVAYVSHVFHSDAHFTPEQSHHISLFVGHSREEAHFFLLLVLRDRSGTPELREYYERQIQECLEQRLVLSHRLGVKQWLSVEDQSVYYSSWYYAAVHVMVSVPGLQSVEALSRRLGLSPGKIANIVEFLRGCGLVTEKKGRLDLGKARLHLGHDSPLISKHHINWRVKAISSLEKNVSGAEQAPQDLHYSSAVVVSKKDVRELKALLVKTIEDFKARVRTSGSESVHAFSLDFFEL